MGGCISSPWMVDTKVYPVAPIPIPLSAPQHHHLPLDTELHQNDEDNKCIICDGECTPKIVLDCKHIFHAECIVKWWGNFPGNGLCCPLCRQKTYNKCYFEITEDEQLPCGYYRHDCIHTEPIIFRRKILIPSKTRIVCLPTKDARDIALYGFMTYLAMISSDRGTIHQTIENGITM